MSVRTRLLAFAAVVALAFGAGAIAGDVAGPIDTGSPPTGHGPMEHGR